MRKWIAVTATLGAVALLALTLPRLAPRRITHRVEAYLYEDTRELVMLVEDAAALVEARGPGAFVELGRRGSRWLDEATYLFVYDTDGTCVFHPVTPELVGRNLIDLEDVNGKPVIRLVTDVGRRPEQDAAGWVFYLWAERTQLTPSWKSSYIRKAVAPDGKVYCVGSGRSEMKVEKAFVTERVDRAAEMLRGPDTEAALRLLLDPSGPFNFLATFVFVMDDEGRTVVDPAFPTLGPRDLTSFRDALGHAVIRQVLTELASSEVAWEQYMSPKPGAILPSRKLLYVRKVATPGRTLVVGADFYLASPIWMKL